MPIIPLRCKGELGGKWIYSRETFRKENEIHALKRIERKNGIAILKYKHPCNRTQLKYAVSVKHKVVWVQVQCYGCNEVNNLIIKLDENKYKAYVNPKQVS
jgi:hypothetical protein